MNKIFWGALVALASVVAAGENLFPADGIAQFARQGRWQFVALPAEGGAPEGLRAASEKKLEPIWTVETSAAVAFGVKKGDLVALTAVVRGIAANGEAELVAKLQDKTYEGVFKDSLRGVNVWRRQRVFGVAKRDYAPGSLRLHLYPGLKRQAVEVRDWTLENFGPVEPSSLPTLKPVPQGWPAAELKLPVGPPPPGPIELPLLSDAERATKRYIIIKLDDFGSGPAGAALYPKGQKIVDYLK